MLLVRKQKTLQHTHTYDSQIKSVQMSSGCPQMTKPLVLISHVAGKKIGEKKVNLTAAVIISGVRIFWSTNARSIDRRRRRPDMVVKVEHISKLTMA